MQQENKLREEEIEREEHYSNLAEPN